jgi:hypothetical protein
VWDGVYPFTWWCCFTLLHTYSQKNEEAERERERERDKEREVPKAIHCRLENIDREMQTRRTPDAHLSIETYSHAHIFRKHPTPTPPHQHFTSSQYNQPQVEGVRPVGFEIVHMHVMLLETLSGRDVEVAGHLLHQNVAVHLTALVALQLHLLREALLHALRNLIGVGEGPASCAIRLLHIFAGVAAGGLVLRNSV